MYDCLISFNVNMVRIGNPPLRVLLSNQKAQFPHKYTEHWKCYYLDQVSLLINHDPDPNDLLSHPVLIDIGKP